eukprot:gene39753-48400_t
MEGEESVCNLYEVLGIEPNAPHKVVKSAYHRLARQYHPDKGSTERHLFNDINRAWVVLGSEASRREYDQKMRDEIKAFDAALRSAEEVTVTDFDFSPENEEYFRNCRCGEGFRLRPENLVYSSLLVPCSGCSLNVKVTNKLSEDSDEVCQDINDTE